MYILGIDCANKSLAISIVEVNIEAFVPTSGSVEERLRHLQEYVDNKIKICYINLFDLIPGKKVRDTSSEYRTRRLKAVLYAIDCVARGFGKIDLVLIEYQMSHNDKSRDISAKLLYHFSNVCSEFSSIYPVSVPLMPVLYSSALIVGPSLKQKVSFAPHLKYSLFCEKYCSNYTANKAHSKANFIHFAAIFEYDITAIPKKNIDDVADSFMMIVGYLKNEKYIKL